jgi:hypothetical protein
MAQPAAPLVRAETTAPTQVVQAVAVAPARSQEHAIEGYTLSAPNTSGAGSVDGDQTSLGDAARAVRAKKSADPN